MRRGFAVGALGVWLVWGCGTPEVSPLEPPPIEVRTWLEGAPSASGGTVVVQTAFVAGGEVELPRLEVEGLKVQALDEPRVEQIGGREVITQRYRFSGSKGSYLIPALEATVHLEGQEPLREASSPLYVDLGVEPPRGELADIADPGAVWTVPWGSLAVVGGVGGLLVGGLWLALRGVRHRPEAALPVEPPDVVALRRWDAVRSDPSLDEEAKATAISLIFREYVEATLGFPAASWTTTEILDRLSGMVHLPQGNVPRAKRLLRATDRLKYADASATEELFEDLDADLRAFVRSTRAPRWEES